jgi:phosphate transport system protein
MLKTALDMVMDSILSFTKEDIALANDVIKRDDIVDKLYEDIIEYLINATGEQKVSPAFAIYNTLVVKYLERIADHAVNIAEWVIYIINGYYKDKQIF